MVDKSQKKIIILGSGPAGYTAAIYAARANLNPILITGIEKGGQLMTTTDVENWPGDHDGLLGPDLMSRMEKHALKYNVEIIFDHIKEVNFQNAPYILVGDSDTYNTDALIISTGASAKYLGLESEKKFMGKGVSACATCDGFFYKEKNVCVVGGGNTAVEEALYLSNIAKHVTLIHRRDSLRAEKILQNRLFDKKNVSIEWSHTLQEVKGNDIGVTSIAIESTDQKQVKEIPTDGLFIAIGHNPNTEIFKGHLSMDNEGYLEVNPNKTEYATQCNKAGIFAAGDVIDKVYRQAITSAGTGCMAALDAEKYLESLS